MRTQNPWCHVSSKLVNLSILISWMHLIYGGCCYGAKISPGLALFGRSGMGKTSTLEETTGFQVYILGKSPLMCLMIATCPSTTSSVIIPIWTPISSSPFSYHMRWTLSEESPSLGPTSLTPDTGGLRKKAHITLKSATGTLITSADNLLIMMR